MRIAALILFSIAVSGGGVAVGQGAATARDAGDARSQERPEEIIVRGKRLVEFRVEVELARERAYAIFNEINSNDDFDVGCRLEPKTGTRLGRQVCAARFEGRISSRASKDYIAAIKANCPGGLAADCMFDPNVAGFGILAAKAVEGEAPRQRDLLEEEIHRLARTDLRFGQAILDFYDASVRYEEERKRPRERREE